jgi:hypothetical protein
MAFFKKLCLVSMCLGFSFNSAYIAFAEPHKKEDIPRMMAEVFVKSQADMLATGAIKTSPRVFSESLRRIMEFQENISRDGIVGVRDTRSFLADLSGVWSEDDDNYWVQHKILAKNLGINKGTLLGLFALDFFANREKTRNYKQFFPNSKYITWKCRTRIKQELQELSTIRPSREPQISPVTCVQPVYTPALSNWYEERSYTSEWNSEQFGEFIYEFGF